MNTCTKNNNVLTQTDDKHRSRVYMLSLWTFCTQTASVRQYTMLGDTKQVPTCITWPEAFDRVQTFGPHISDLPQILLHGPLGQEDDCLYIAVFFTLVPFPLVDNDCSR